MKCSSRHAAPYDARAVANFLLDIADARGIPLTQLSLLKLIYFSHGWYLATRSEPLVLNDFEAWERGPVINIVRECFKGFGKNPIRSRAENLDIFTGEVTIVPTDLSDDDKNFIDSIFLAYHVYDAWKLSEMTHEEGSPWERVWKLGDARARLGLRITNAEIKAHFESVARRLRSS